MLNDDDLYLTSSTDTESIKSRASKSGKTRKKSKVKRSAKKNYHCSVGQCKDRKGAFLRPNGTLVRHFRECHPGVDVNCVLRCAQHDEVPAQKMTSEEIQDTGTKLLDSKLEECSCSEESNKFVLFEDIDD